MTAGESRAARTRAPDARRVTGRGPPRAPHRGCLPGQIVARVAVISMEDRPLPSVADFAAERSARDGRRQIYAWLYSRAVPSAAPPDRAVETQELAQFVDAWERFGRAARRARGRANQDASCALSHAQYQLVEPLLDGQPLTVCRLAEAAGVAQPTATRMLAGLVRDGVIRRLADAGDRRVALIELTSDGARLVDRKRDRLNAVRAQIFASIPDHQRAQAAELLDRLTDAMDQL